MAGRAKLAGRALRRQPMLAVTPERAAQGARILPEEVAVALSYNGSTHAVMMATPADLEDFARGFTLTEGIARPDEIESVTPVALPLGIDLQIWLVPEAAERIATRRRTMAGPVGCGLCGLDSLAEAVRAPVRVAPGTRRLTTAAIMAAVEALPGHQPLHDAAHALHAAGFWHEGRMILAREDVGRHNALDKLAGAMLAAGLGGGEGALVLTSRLSLDLVQKAARICAPVLVGASAPTGAALDHAAACGIAVVAMARPGRLEIFTHAERIEITEPAHVA